MDVPGRDPLILLWAWWVSLALSRSLNLRHSPCGFLYNHLYCPPMTLLQVCVLRWLVAEVTSMAPSPSATSRRRFPPTSPANLLSFRCFLVILFVKMSTPVLLNVVSVPFPRFLRVFSIFACQNTKLLLSFLCQT